ncbi:MAG: type I polyketide synthase, partial [Candidatus Eremiobacterota bacterium]
PGRLAPATRAPLMAASPGPSDGVAVPVAGSGPVAEAQARLVQAAAATAEAHDAFLRFSTRNLESMGRAVQLQTRILETLVQCAPAQPATPWLPREGCLEFARGSIAKALGPEFAPVDSHPTRVRLPDEPLMLVDRIMLVEGEPRSMGAGRVVTEHDVRPGAWYLDGGCAPVCISVEAGQADLFLSGWLGIDFVTRGLRVYRLLDAEVVFHRGLPRVGETIRYDIHIDRFVRQGEVVLFFFRFEGSVAGQPLISMRDGCAGFFTCEEIEGSGGILEAGHLPPEPRALPPDWTPLVPFDAVESYSDEHLESLRQGDLVGCFGPRFANLPLRDPLRLPGPPMNLLHRVLELDPRGGRYGLGRIRGEASIRPDDWFLTCHFVDDMVMPGTLMYECCAHTLRFFLLRMGWVAEASEVTCEPIMGIPAVLRCRGPVDVRTRKVLYEVEIQELGYRPEPYCLADALMYADGKPIVRFTGMSLRLVGLTRERLSAIWAGSERGATGYAMPPFDPPGAVSPFSSKPVLYGPRRIMEFSVGRPSLAFGEPYAVFDSQRRIARLPGPPYLFMDRVVELNQPPWELRPGGWIESEYAVPPDAWYFRANRQETMAFCVLLEIALQPCGWLAAYLGSALKSAQDTHFRNLGGTATLHREVTSDAGTLTVRVRMTDVSEAAGMIIEHFDLQVLAGSTMLYEGTTYFGFFSAAALAQQIGVRDALERRFVSGSTEGWALPRHRPHHPEDPGVEPGERACLPAGALLMLDEVDCWLPDGGPHGLGFLRGVKTVDPREWFFRAHFYQDPVWPGSLGLEAFLQLLKVAALQRWPEKAGTHRFEAIATGRPHTWTYRGQVIPSNRRVEVEVSITRSEDGLLVGDGFLVVDGLVIYEMRDFAVRLVP